MPCKLSQWSVILHLPIKYQNLCTLSSSAVPVFNILFLSPHRSFFLSPASLFLPEMLMASKLTFLTLSTLPNKPHHHSTKLHPLPLISSRLNVSKDPTILNTHKILDQSSNALKTASLSLTAVTLPFLLDQKARDMSLVFFFIPSCLLTLVSLKKGYFLSHFVA